MYAVKMLNKIENFFDRNHNLFLKFGGLFAVLFLGIYAPFNMLARMDADMSEKLSAYEQQNIILSQQVNDMSHELNFLRLSYAEKQRVMAEVDCLARNIYFEASTESRVGKIAVAEVTMNRVKSRHYPKNVCSVVHQKRGGVCQFSWVCQRKSTRIPNSKSWHESLKIAENILISKKRYGIIGNAKYYHADYVYPAWADSKEKVAQIGRHIFYR